MAWYSKYPGLNSRHYKLLQLFEAKRLQRPSPSDSRKSALNQKPEGKPPAREAKSLNSKIKSCETRKRPEPPSFRGLGSVLISSRLLISLFNTCIKLT